MEWRNETLVYLQSDNLIRLKEDLEIRGVPFSCFHEPDVGDALTSIAVLQSGRDNLFKKLRLVGDNLNKSCVY